MIGISTNYLIENVNVLVCETTHLDKLGKL